MYGRHSILPIYKLEWEFVQPFGRYQGLIETIFFRYPEVKSANIWFRGGDDLLWNVCI